MQAQKTQHTTTPAPYFLPLQQSSATSYFSLSSSHSATKQKRPQLAQQRENVATNSYFKTNNVSYSTKQKEVESQSNSRLTALHSSLQQEAEKIRKWKNATELELKHKEKCLGEANSTIETQRKSLTELQLKNESLQSKLNDEVINQKELQRKIVSTREMCTALKDHCIKIDRSIIKGQEDRDHLMLINQERVSEYQELLKKYRQLDKGQEEWHKRNQEALAVESGKLAEAENECHEVSLKLEEACNKISSLELQSSEDKVCISNLSEKIEAKSLLYDTVTKEKSELEIALYMKNDALKELEHQIHDLTQRLTISDQQLTQHVEQLGKTQSKLEENESQYSEKISRLEDSLVSKVDRCRDLQEDKACLESKLAQSSSEHKAKYQEMQGDLEEKVSELSHSRETCEALEVELGASKKSCDELEGVKSHLNVQISRLQDEVEGLKESLNQEIAEKEKGLEKAESLISNVASRHEGARRCWLDKEQALEKQLEVVTGEKEELASERKTLISHLEDLKNALETQICVSTEQSTKHEECIGEFNVNKNALIDENTALKKRILVLTDNEENLTAQCSNLEKVESENQQLKSSLEAKESLTEQLQTKMSELENETSSKAEEQNLLIEQLRSEASALNTRSDENHKCYEVEVAALKEESLMRAKELTSLLEMAKKEVVDAKKELDQEKQSCTRKVDDLAAALDSYRSERETAMANKDKKIESLKGQLHESEKSKEESDGKVKLHEDEIERLSSEINLKNEELKQLLKSVEAVCNKGTNSTSHTPAIPSTPVRKTPLGRSALYRSKITPQPPATALRDYEVSSTPQLSSCNVSTSASTKSCHQPLLPCSTPRPLKPPIPATPTTRMYSYSVVATPQYRNKLSTPKYSSRSGKGQKRVRCESNTDCGTRGGGRTKHRENISYGPEDDEAVFKKPKDKDASVTIQKASSTTRGKKPKAKAAPRGKSNPDPSTADMSWFDLDAVYGFGSADYD